MSTNVSPDGSLPEIIPQPAADAPPRPVTPTTTRIDSIDLLRGIVMVIMMLDHTRDFVHRDVLLGFDPTDLARTNVVLFFTRWITHFCAPVFVFLAGTGAYLQFARGKSKRELSRFLLTRGLWLIVLEFTVIRVAVTFNVDYSFLGGLQVIWALGVSMIVLAALIYLPLRVVGVFGVGMIALHNLLDGIKVQSWQGPQSAVPSFGAKLWILLHQGFEAFPVLWFFPSPVVFVVYPIIPWVGVMAAGYAFGAVYRWDVQQRRRLLLVMGSIATALFIILRLINAYGDPARWAKQNTASFTLLSFLNTTKYPPSLLFLLMTLGPALLMLAWFESGTAPAVTNAGRMPALPRPQSLVGRLRGALVTFGRVPLFFYILQWFTAHIISVIAHFVAGKPVRWMFESDTFITGPPPGVGFSLAVVYVCWIVGVLLLYPLCKWFAGVKARRRDWWLSYL
ncbi:MAG: DUF1624 domain-containing protein [Pyrinomonadaceae bacterium]|nr:DUF1624 domain-containing protein [Pyrinomonadaceae bacterium]